LTQDPNLPSTLPSGLRRPSPPASRAGWLAMAIGVLLILAGGCFAACGFLLPYAQLSAEQEQNLKQLEAQFHGSLTTIFIAIGCVVAVAGIYHIVIGFFVRRGNRSAIYSTIVTSFLLMGWCVLNTLGGLVMGAPNAAAGVCFLVVIGALFVWLIRWLFQALRSSTSTAAMAQYQAQYWQSLQQQQAFAQPPAPGVPPPPAVPFAPPPPPQPPSPEPTGWAYGAQTPPPPPRA
jgi:hypothetical protein